MFTSRQNSTLGEKTFVWAGNSCLGLHAQLWCSVSICNTKISLSRMCWDHTLSLYGNTEWKKSSPLALSDHDHPYVEMAWHVVQQRAKSLLRTLSAYDFSLADSLRLTKLISVAQAHLTHCFANPTPNRQSQQFVHDLATQAMELW